MASTEFAPIRSGGSLIVAWRTKEKNILIVGGNDVAAARIISVLEADAKVILVSPENELSEEVRYRIEQNQVHKWINREFKEIDLEDVDMVLTAIDDLVVSRKIYDICHAKKIPINVADVPPLCDFYFMSQHRDGPLQIAVSTNGQGPKMANIIRRKIGETLPEGIGDVITKVGRLRQKLRILDSKQNSSSKRMGWMSRVCEEWSLEDLKKMDEKIMDNLLLFYESGQVPQYDSILCLKNNQEDILKNTTKKSVEEVGETSHHMIENRAYLTFKDKDHENYQPDNLDSIKEFNYLTIQSKDARISSQSLKKGRMILVGAGPGDPSLLTHKATTALATADLVLSDRLIPSPILSHANCEIRLAASKSGAEKSRDSQDQLSTWGLEALKEGKTVVRLKIGDPFLFGRGGEEVAFFRKHGWDVEVVPGISSAFSAPLAANVPVTHRGVADQVLITTGQGTQGRMPEIPRYHSTRTTVILMAVAKANEMSKALLEKEYPGELPGVFIENSNRPNQRIIRATVRSLGEAVKTQKIVSPATLVIGHSVEALYSKDLDFSGIAHEI
ncbi:hypothetical protein G9A89_023355 [Geosiphon pyriformis]|nr:hypothetical protein G9A89_023355 [Geosiphon pyriformis]